MRERPCRRSDGGQLTRHLGDHAVSLVPNQPNHRGKEQRERDAAQERELAPSLVARDGGRSAQQVPLRDQPTMSPSPSTTGTCRMCFSLITSRTVASGSSGCTTCTSRVMKSRTRRFDTGYLLESQEPDWPSVRLARVLDREDVSDSCGRRLVHVRKPAKFVGESLLVRGQPPVRQHEIDGNSECRGSEFLRNGRGCRADDIHDALLLDAFGGVHECAAPSIISSRERCRPRRGHAGRPAGRRGGPAGGLRRRGASPR